MKIAALVCGSIISLAISMGWVMNNVVICNEGSVVSHARGIAEVFAEARQTYAEVRGHDSDPLPIEFARKLADRIHGANISVYSPYPFPENPHGGLNDDFETEAWIQLVEKGELEYFKWEESGILRYAIPDVMGQKCVECHNKATNTPKNDWVVGDVRGIIEVSVPRIQ